jgi:hypothetical protein
MFFTKRIYVCISSHAQTKPLRNRSNPVTKPSHVSFSRTSLLDIYVFAIVVIVAVERFHMDVQYEIRRRW